MKTLYLTVHGEGVGSPSLHAFIRLLVERGSLVEVLPNVRDLRLDIFDRLDLFAVLLTPTLSLKRLEIHLWSASVAESFLIAMKDSVQSLQHFKIKYRYHWKRKLPLYLVHMLADVVRVQTQLQELHASLGFAFTEKLFQAAETLPRLATLELDPLPFDSVPINGFPSLRHITLDRSNPDSAESFLAGITTPALRTIDMTLGWTDSTACATALHNFSRFRALLSLRLKTVCFDWTPSQVIFESILPCSLLTHLELEGIWGQASEITDASIRTLARALPALQELRIIESHHPDATPNTTLYALEILAQHCPALRSLSMCLYAQRDLVDLWEWSPVTCTSLEEIDLLCSPAGDVHELVADLIRDLFPNLRRLGASKASVWQNESEDGMNAQRWDSIWESYRNGGDTG